MKKLIYLLFIFSFMFATCFANVEQQEEYKNDYLYSDAYFDYLIECASMEQMKQAEIRKEEKKIQEKLNKEYKDENVSLDLDAGVSNDSKFDSYEDAITVSDSEIFKLRIENFSSPSKYGETFKKENTKTIIPVNSKFSFVQDMTKMKNKYNSNDYKILAGAEFTPCKFFMLASGVEANYRDIDQIPTSRKLYLTPSLNLGDKFSLSFYNKYDTTTRATDHDLGINISPFKTKVMDFGVYAGLTRNPSGTHSESVNFRTNFYFF